MLRLPRRWFIAAVCAIYLAHASGLRAEANLAESEKSLNFRVDTDIYSDPKKKPVKHSLTLFADKIYYDFEDGERGRITVIDPHRHRIVLIDRERKVKSIQKTDDIQLMIANARVQTDARLSAASKKEIEKTESGEKIAVIKNDSIEYRSTMQSLKAPSMAAQYADFANWSARLNSVHPPMLPPYLRIDLNDLIASENAMPKEITKTSRKGFQETKFISRLAFIDRISIDDESKIARAQQMVAEFHEVSIDDYWKTAENKPVSNASNTVARTER